MTSIPNIITSARKQNIPDVDKGNSVVWNEQYLIPHTVVFGKVAVRATSDIIDMGYSEIHWGDVKCIKSINHFYILTDNTEKDSRIYTKDRLD